ncbi:MAG: hypothetical protein ABEI98_05235 [Halorhabdus sp.]
MIDLLSLIVLSLQGAILGLCVVAARRRNVAALVNTVGSLALALTPTALEIISRARPGSALTIDPTLTLWLALAGLLHSLGMLGLYDSTWWWDHLTHTVSAALVAAVLYAGFIVSPDPVRIVGFDSFAALTVAFTFAVGVFWELVELVAREVGDRLDVDPVLVYYGWQDTALDLVFDLVGALVVVAFDLRTFVPVVERYAAVTTGVLVVSGWTVAIGSLAMALFVGIAGTIWTRQV